MSFNDELKIRQSTFEINGGYNQDAMPEVYSHYKAYIATGNFPYNRVVAEYIRDIEIVPIELMKYLTTEVYLASQQYKREKDTQYKIKMISDGWLELTPESVTKEVGKNIEVNGVIDGEIFSHSLTGIFKPIISNGYAYLMKPRATRKGLLVNNIQNAYYKVIEKS